MTSYGCSNYLRRHSNYYGFKLWMEKMDRMTDWINFSSRMEVILKNKKNARNENTEEWKYINNALMDSSADLTHPKRESMIFKLVQFSSVQSLSRVRLFATPWIAARQASLSITISRSSLRLTSIESVMPSSRLILGRPLLLLPPVPPSISLFQWVSSSHEVAKVLELQL